jgi:hypothetical protein
MGMCWRSRELNSSASYSNSSISLAAIHDDATTIIFDRLASWATALKPLRKETTQ